MFARHQSIFSYPSLCNFDRQFARCTEGQWARVTVISSGPVELVLTLGFVAVQVVPGTPRGVAVAGLRRDHVHNDALVVIGH